MTALAIGGRFTGRRIARSAGIAVAAALLTSACAAGQLAQTSQEKSVIDGTNVTLRSIDLRGVSIQGPTAGTARYIAGTAAQLQIVIVNNSNQPDTLTSITSPSIGGWATFAAYVDASRVQQARLAALTPAPSAASSSAPSPAPSSSSAPGSTGSRTSPRAIVSAGRSSSSRKSRSTSPPPSKSPSTAAALPTGTSSLALPANGRIGFGTPEAKGAILLLPVTKALYPGTTVSLTFTFDHAGSITVAVPVQVSTSVATQVGNAPATGGN